MTTSFRHRLASASLPRGAQLAFAAIALLNLPGAFFGGLFFWTILPIPGLLIYGCVVALAFQRGSLNLARRIGKLGLIYNLLLFALLLTMLIERGDLGDVFWVPLSMMTFTLGTAGLYGIALQVMGETQDEA